MARRTGHEWQRGPAYLRLAPASPTGEAFSRASRERLRATFEEDPDLYDRARPTYPPQVFDDLAALARLPEGADLVEIGCGTGQATIPLAERGYRITCVELGEQLVAVARRKLSIFPAVEVINAAFETWEAPRAKFDAVVAFTAFHWVDPTLRYAKARSVLRKGGALAVVASMHVLPAEGDRFFADVQEDYEAVISEDEQTRAGGPPAPEAVGDLRPEAEASGLFGNVTVRRYLWDVGYTADEYIALLNTYPEHRALDDATREHLYDRIRRRIETRPSRTVQKTLLATLNVAHSL